MYQTYGTNKSTVIVAHGTGSIPATTVDRATIIGFPASFNALSVVSTAIGAGPTVGTGTGNLSIGYTANASGGGIAISKGGFSATSTGGIAIGGNVTSGTNGVAIGNGTTSAGANGTAVGNSAAASAVSSVAYGYSANASGNYSLAIGDRAASAHQNSIALGLFAKSNAANQFIAGGTDAGGLYGITDVYFGTGPARDQTNSGPGTNYTIHGSGAYGSNQNGGNLTIAGGKGTGIGTPGDVVISTATAGASGTTLQSLTPRLTIKSGTGQLILSSVSSLPTYADEAAATAAGLASGTFYKSSDGIVRIKL